MKCLGVCRLGKELQSDRGCFRAPSNGGHRREERRGPPSVGRGHRCPPYSTDPEHPRDQLRRRSCSFCGCTGSSLRPVCQWEWPTTVSLLCWMYARRPAWGCCQTCKNEQCLWLLDCPCTLSWPLTFFSWVVFVLYCGMYLRLVTDSSQRIRSGVSGLL